MVVQIKLTRSCRWRSLPLGNRPLLLGIIGNFACQGRAKKQVTTIPDWIAVIF
jgi:hypothetical protein